MESFSVSLVSYLPSTILNYLLDDTISKPATPPFVHSFTSACLFADISGFTMLSEAMRLEGARGDELLAKHLNSYFELLVRTISGQGGDVFKFAGDALLVVWPPSDEDLETTTRRACQCALEINAKLQEVHVTDNIVLNIKVGVGVGPINILHVGGVFERLEYLATGPALVQAFAAEHHATRPEVVVSPQVWAYAGEYFVGRPTTDVEALTAGDDLHEGKFVFLKTCKRPLRKVSVFKSKNQPKLIRNDILGKIMKYVPGAVLPYVNKGEEKWASELRRITVLFVNLGMKLENVSEHEDIMRVQKTLRLVQHHVYRYEGSLNKFLMDDKGSTLIAVFGLPPLAHEDDAARGTLCALAICAKLQELQLKASVGVTSGLAFCGVVGSRGRREYSVLGDTVNLSARLMQYAVKHQMGVLCDLTTQYVAKDRLHFQSVGSIKVKGKTKEVEVFQPYPIEMARMVESLSDQHIITLGKTEEGKAALLQLPNQGRTRRGYSVSTVSRVTEQRIADMAKDIPKDAVQDMTGLAREMGEVIMDEGDYFSLSDLKEHSMMADEAEIESRVTRKSRVRRSMSTSSMWSRLKDSMLRRPSQAAGSGERRESLRSNGSTDTEDASPRDSLNSLSSLIDDTQSPNVSKETAPLTPTSRSLKQSKHKPQLSGINEDSVSAKKMPDGEAVVPQVPSRGFNMATLNVDGMTRPRTPSLGSKQIKLDLQAVARLSVRDEASNLPRVNSRENTSLGDVLKMQVTRSDDSLHEKGSGATEEKRSSGITTPKRHDRHRSASVMVENIADALQREAPATLEGDVRPQQTVVDVASVNVTGLQPQGGASDASQQWSKEFTVECSAFTTVAEVHAAVLKLIADDDSVTFPVDPAKTHLKISGLPLYGAFKLQNFEMFTLARKKLLNDKENAVAMTLGLNPDESSAESVVEKITIKLLTTVLKFLETLRTNTVVNDPTTVLLEGDMGYGKSRVLKNFVAVSPLLTFTACANPYEMHRPLRVWTDVFGQLIDYFVIESLPSSYTSFVECKRKWIRSRLRSISRSSESSGKKKTSSHTLEEMAPCLNNLFYDVEFPETKTTSGMTKEHKTAQCAKLLIILAENLTRTCPVMCVIDDAVYLDSASWSLILHLRMYCKNMVIILATRPVNVLTLANFSKVAEDYTKLLEEKTLVRLSMDKRSSKEIVAIARVALEDNWNVFGNVQNAKIDKLPLPLEKIIVAKAQGNPLVVKEFVYELVHRRMLSLTRPPSSNPTGFWSVNVRIEVWMRDQEDLPVPITLQLLYGAQLDKLTFQQSMLLKTASNIGSSFTFYDLNLMMPSPQDSEIQSLNTMQPKTGLLARGARITKDLRLLCDLKLLNNSWPDKPATGARMAKYTFTQGFLREFIIFRTLNEQHNILDTCATRAHQNSLPELPVMPWPLRTPNMTAMMPVRKNREICEEWKQRHWTLHIEQGVLCAWRTAEEAKTMACEPFLVLYLQHLNASVDLDTIQDIDYRYMAEEVPQCLILRSRTWLKRGNLHMETRYFFLSCDSTESLFHWQRQVDLGIDVAIEKSIKSLQTERLHAIALEEALLTEFDAEERAGFIQTFAHAVNAPAPESLMYDRLDIYKQKSKLGNPWKRRWVKLGPACIFIMDGDKGDKNEYSEVLDLAAGGVKVDVVHMDNNREVSKTERKGEVANKKPTQFFKFGKREMFLFRVETMLWRKGSDINWTKHASVFACASEEARQDWVSAIQQQIEKHLHRRVEAKYGARVTQALARHGSYMREQVFEGAVKAIGRHRQTVSQDKKGSSNNSDVKSSPQHLQRSSLKQALSPRDARRSTGSLVLSTDGKMTKKEKRLSNKKRGQDNSHKRGSSKRGSSIIRLNPNELGSITVDPTRRSITGLNVKLTLPSDGLMEEDPLFSYDDSQMGLMALDEEEEYSGDDHTGGAHHKRRSGSARRRSSNRSSVASRINNLIALREDHELDDMEDEDGDSTKLKQLLFDLNTRIHDYGGEDEVVTLLKRVRKFLVENVQPLLDYEAQSRASVYNQRSSASQGRHSSFGASRNSLQRLQGKVQKGNLSQNVINLLENSNMDADTKKWLTTQFTRQGRTSSDTTSRKPAPALMDPSFRLGDFAPIEQAICTTAELDAVSRWDFELIKDGVPLNVTQLQKYVFVLFEAKTGLLSKLKVDHEKFRSLVQAIFNGYHDNPYHSHVHAFDVCQSLSVVLYTHGMHNYLSPLEQFSLLVAALMHDIGHPGLTNAYQANAGTELALRYNDQSVLEQHHSALFFAETLAAVPGVFGTWEKEEYRQFRSIVTQGVLHTDMTHHFALVDKLTTLLGSYSLPSEDPTSMSSDTMKLADRHIVMQVLLHAADISNPVKPWTMCRWWSDAIQQEFFAQGAREKEEGLPVSLNCDARTTIQSVSQLNFMDFIVAPLFIELVGLSYSMRSLLSHASRNRREWHSIMLSVIEVKNGDETWVRRDEAFNNAVAGAVGEMKEGPLELEDADDDADNTQAMQAERQDDTPPPRTNLDEERDAIVDGFTC